MIYYIVLCNNFKDAECLFEIFLRMLYEVYRDDPSFYYTVYDYGNSVLTTGNIMYIFIDHIMKDVYEKTAKQKSIEFMWYDDFFDDVPDIIDYYSDFQDVLS